MRDTYTRLFVHTVWATWDRAPLLVPELERVIYAALRAECAKLRVEPLEIGGAVDHVHVLAQLPATVSVAEWVKQMKGATSHLATHQVTGADGFRWQGAYGALTVSESDIPRVRAYITRQKQHHADGTWDVASEPEDRTDSSVVAPGG